jgi:hypothetical protein
MRSARVVLAIAGTALLVLGGCGSKSAVPELMNLRSSTNGPDEFGILPPKPLELPLDLATLPEPTPGGTNLSDRDPMADALIALGGQPGDAAGPIPSGDAGLYSYVIALGGGADIRAVLAAEDLRFRQKNRGRPLERWFNTNVYFKAYEKMWLDQEAELARWRKAGAKTPSAPPSAAP